MTIVETTSLVVIILTFISGIVTHYKILNCHSICCDSECAKAKSAPPTPATRVPTLVDNLNEYQL